jgi:Na+/H+-dicarboxylate symporter
VFCLIGAYTASKGLDIFGDLAQYVLLLIFVLVLHMLIVNSLFLKFIAGVSPVTFFRKIKDVLLFGFSTSSSAATIPVTLKTVTEDMGVKKDVASFVIPVGATINMNGTAILQGLATFFIAGISGIELGMGQYIQIIFLAVITAIGTAAVPSAGIITLTIILNQLGLPLEGIGLILAVDRILDMLRTSVNVCGDAAIAVIVAATEDELDRDKFNTL